jgi:hypothetical protein
LTPPLSEFIFLIRERPRGVTLGDFWVSRLPKKLSFET